MTAEITVQIRTDSARSASHGSGLINRGWRGLRARPGELVEISAGKDERDVVVRIEVPSGEDDRGPVLDAIEEILNGDRGVPFTSLTVLSVRPV